MRIHIESTTSYRGRNSRPNWLALAVFIGLALSAGAVGAIFSPGGSARAAEWYAMLAEARLVAARSLVRRRLDGAVSADGDAPRGSSGANAIIANAHAALTAYAIQLLLNALWAPLFFGARNIGAGLFVAVALWLTIIWTVREFAAVRAVAAWLMAPYVIWASFAMALNLSIWRLNP